jgi:DNA gyrase/topoisomerase IV subunit B
MPGISLSSAGIRPRPRRGISVVAALSEWLVHTNRRRDDAWTQRYEHGIPSAGRPVFIGQNERHGF